ncbi:hypothetical protein EDB82DRAFT_332074 [Fusarium venenatum]|uniref:uncharacterized protein n=1 Tax=Fusarium venenatum TaxID=56646 RepID=UPI001D38E0B6|nr:hypothetical protein EDB82DRAFT_332074 [Fusarium venenatum]
MLISPHFLGCLFLHPKASSCTPCYFATVATATRSNINDSSATGEDHRGHRTVSSQDWLDDKQNSPNLFTRSIIPEKEDKFIKDITKSFSKETAPLFQYRIDKDLS